MDVRIIDALGLKSGVQIGNVRAEYDEKKQELKIHGMLYRREHFNNRKKRIICSVFDKENRVLFNKEGEIYGSLGVLDRVPFSLIISNYCNVDWSDTTGVWLMLCE